MVPNEGKKKIIESYLNNNDIYVGIWSDTIFNYSNILSMDTIQWFEISNYLGYKRHKILAGDWLLTDTTNMIYTAQGVMNFDVDEDWENLTGYFLTDRNDNTGKLLSLVKFGAIISIDIGNLSEDLVIQPTIRLL